MSSSFFKDFRANSGLQKHGFSLLPGVTGSNTADVARGSADIGMCRNYDLAVVLMRRLCDSWNEHKTETMQSVNDIANIIKYKALLRYARVSGSAHSILMRIGDLMADVEKELENNVLQKGLSSTVLPSSEFSLLVAINELHRHDGFAAAAAQMQTLNQMKTSMPSRRFDLFLAGHWLSNKCTRSLSHQIFKLPLTWICQPSLHQQLRVELLAAVTTVTNAILLAWPGLNVITEVVGKRVLAKR